MKHLQLFVVWVILCSFQNLYAEMKRCQGTLTLNTIHSVESTRSGRTYVRADVHLRHKAFKNCPQHYLRLLKDGKNERIPVTLEMEAYKLRAKRSYKASLRFDPAQNELYDIIITGLSGTEKKPTRFKGFKHYEGNGVSLQYPATFTPMSTDMVALDASPFEDEVHFISPDQRVTFYLFHSPPVGYEEPSVLKPAPNEILISEKAQKSNDPDTYYDYLFTSWRTFKAKDGSYYRSIMAQRVCHNGKFDECGFKIFGITYKDKKSYDRYKADYLRFKKSLIEWHVK